MEIDMKDMLAGVSMQAQESGSTYTTIYTSDGIALSNTVLGGLAGAVIAIAIIIIKDMLDTTIRTKKDLEDKFEDIPVIGTIPGIKQR